MEQSGRKQPQMTVRAAAAKLAQLRVNRRPQLHPLATEPRWLGGVDGSSPSEGFPKADKRGLFLWALLSESPDSQSVERPSILSERQPRVVLVVEHLGERVTPRRRRDEVQL